MNNMRKLMEAVLTPTTDLASLNIRRKEIDAQIKKLEKELYRVERNISDAERNAKWGGRQEDKKLTRYWQEYYDADSSSDYAFNRGNSPKDAKRFRNMAKEIYQKVASEYSEKHAQDMAKFAIEYYERSTYDRGWSYSKLAKLAAANNITTEFMLDQGLID